MMSERKIFLALAALVIVVLAAFGLATNDRSIIPSRDKADSAAVEEGEGANAASERRAFAALCASRATAARLKEIAFEEAFRVRNADPTDLDRLAASSVLRLENPALKSHDDGADLITCSGRIVLDLPPGAERGFGGERRLAADVEYSAQATTNGIANVFQLNGADILIQRLAAFNLQPAPLPAEAEEVDLANAAAPEVAGAGTNEVIETPPPPAPRPTPTPRPTPSPSPRAPTAGGSAVGSNPSFSCRYAETRGERMVCGSTRLGAKDRAMASVFYSALADANDRQRRELRRTRDRFLAYRDRCRDEACIAEAYDGRMEEIRDIMRGVE